MSTISSEQAASFRSQGFLKVDHFFGDREVAAMRAELARLQAAGKLRNVATDGDGATHSNTQANLQLCPMYSHSPLFRALPFEPKVLAAVQALIGDPFILHLDQVFLKPAGHGMGTSWHQDNGYFRIDNPLQGTAMWIAVHDATVENGTIEVIPGMFGEDLPHERDPYSDHHIRCYPPEERAIPVELAAGGVVFFCYGTPHCTRANRTEADRAGVAFHFLHVDCAKKELIEDDRDYRPYLTGPRATGGETEYGIHVAGTFPKEIEQLLAT